MNLGDIILDGHRTEVESLSGERHSQAKQHYARTKDQLIASLIDLKLYDQVSINLY